jgi:anhydro-N-acetylmuramic acid kinase
MAFYIGLMSGTSLDGVDGVLAEEAAEAGSPLQSRGHVHRAFPPALREELLTLNHSGADELHRAALAANALVRLYADVVQALLQARGLPASAITAIGAHGQTVRHQPGAFDGTGYTLQLNHGALLAELTNIDVVCDFRSRDVAAGGQGAPLVPAFHAASFHQPGQARAVLNLGGIANLTLLSAEGGVLGFDTGPANVLMDLWCQRHTGHGFDEDGRWAASGRVDAALLAACLAEPFFALPPPKSTGRDLFHAAWLDARLADGVARAPADVMATLAALTAHSVAAALHAQAPAAQALFVCGGGAHNGHLLGLLRQALPDMAVSSTATLGVAPDQVEALAFAWLAQACLTRRAGNVPAVTGARGARVLGAIYPAA